MAKILLNLKKEYNMNKVVKLLKTEIDEIDQTKLESYRKYLYVTDLSERLFTTFSDEQKKQIHGFGFSLARLL